jgi:hypothetical protein
MSLGIAIKGPEGIVLAADSRVTLFSLTPPNPALGNQSMVIPANFDNATKLVTVAGQEYVGAVTYGLGALLTPDGPRTMHSFIPEFEQELSQADSHGPAARLPVDEFAQRLSDFYSQQWTKHVGRAANMGEDISFLVGGYDVNAAYGRVFRFQIPTSPNLTEESAGPGQFGITWGGQPEVVYRMLFGYDAQLPALIKTRLNLSQAQVGELQDCLRLFEAGVPYQFLPLKDCVNLAIFLIQSTVRFQTFSTKNVRAVGGPVEIATITRSTPLSRKRVDSVG